MTEDDWVKAINAAEPSLSDLEDLEALLTKSDLPEAVKARLLAWVSKLVQRAKSKKDEVEKAREEEEKTRRKKLVSMTRPRG